MADLEALARVAPGANLRGVYLAGAHLRDANLRGADLTGAHLAGANLRGADLTGAHLGDANLRGADLSRAQLRHAHIIRGHLAGAHLAYAHVMHADLYQADLTDTDLTGAHFDDATLRGARLGGARVPSDSRELVAELLRQQARTWRQLEIASMVLMCRNLCWEQWQVLARRHYTLDERTWIAATLAPWAALRERLAMWPATWPLPAQYQHEVVMEVES